MESFCYIPTLSIEYVVGFMTAVRDEDSTLKIAKAPDLIFEFRFHTEFVDLDFVEYFQEFHNQLLLADALIRAIA